jgi:hypothetical protein
MDPVMRDADSIIDAMKERTPYFSKSLPPRRDFYGEPTVSSEHPILGLAMPINIKEEKPDAVIGEVLRLRVPLPAPPRWIGGTRPSKDPLKEERTSWGVELDTKQYSRYVELARKESKIGGDNFKSFMANMIQQDYYTRQSDGPDGGKAQLIREVAGDFNQQAKMDLLDEDKALAEKVRDRQEGRIKALTPKY